MINLNQRWKDEVKGKKDEVREGEREKDERFKTKRGKLKEIMNHISESFQ